MEVYNKILYYKNNYSASKDLFLIYVYMTKIAKCYAKIFEKPLVFRAFSVLDKFRYILLCRTTMIWYIYKAYPT